VAGVPTPPIAFIVSTTMVTSTRIPPCFQAPNCGHPEGEPA
jgi:hypothetical protein